MLHRLTKIMSAYVSSVCERKHLDLDRQNFTVQIIVSTREANGGSISVTNTINVVNSLPNTYSELVHNEAGHNISFVAGASGNKRKLEQDKLVAAFTAAKGELADSEAAKTMNNLIDIHNARVESESVEARLNSMTAPSVVLIEGMAKKINIAAVELGKAMGAGLIKSRVDNMVTDNAIPVHADDRPETLTELEVKVVKAKKTRVKKVENEPASA